MPRLPRRLPGVFAILFVVAALLAGCKESRYEVEVRFDDAITPDDVRFVELLVLPECPTAGQVLSGEAPEGVIVAGVGLAQTATTQPAIGTLPPGLYGLYGRGFDATCTAVAAGCVTVEVSDHGQGTFVVLLEPTAEVQACTADAVCMDGACVIDPGDACGPYPCTPDAFCTDLADPAPVDPSGRTCTPVTDCGPGEYQVKAPEPRSDRLCTSCTVCDPTDLELIACADGNTAQDRVCGTGGQVCTLAASQDGEATNSILSILDPPSGTASTMRTTGPSNGLYYAFVQFDVAGGACEEGGSLPAGATVQSAVLRLVRTGGCGICGLGHAAQRVTQGWSEGNVTAGLGPGVDASPSATFDAPEAASSVIVSTDGLRDDVQSMLDDPANNHGWRIAQTEDPSNEASPYVWATRESSTATDRPRLVITYAPP